MLGVAVKLLCGGVFDGFPRVHDHNGVAHPPDDAQVVGDQKNGGVGLGAELFQQAEYLGLHRYVQSGGGLVSDKKLGSAADGHSDDHTLAHTA